MGIYTEAIEKYEEFITLAYSDDIALIAKTPVAFQERLTDGMRA